jgi:polysaccharide deacetylase family protein (PEP-CTERM system associated)
MALLVHDNANPKMSTNPRGAQSPRIFPNVLSVDVEDYFQAEAFANTIKRDAWSHWPCRVADNTQRVLDLFDECNVRGTFFFLGWVAERYPFLVQDVGRRRHELACHSHWHRIVDQMTPQEFREDTRRAKSCIEQAAGTGVTGFRAPTFSISRRSHWAPEILLELGFSYDSSFFSITHDRYGIRNTPRTPFLLRTRAGSITEFPLTTFRLPGGPNFPVGGGACLRLFPFLYTSVGIRLASRQGVPITIYFHPWELDPDQPRIAANRLTRVRHYMNLDRMGSRIRRVLARAEFGPYRDLSGSGALPTVDIAELFG